MTRALINNVGWSYRGIESRNGNSARVIPKYCGMGRLEITGFEKNVAVVMPKNRHWQDTGRNFGPKLSIYYGKRNRLIAGYCSSPAGPLLCTIGFGRLC